MGNTFVNIDLVRFSQTALPIAKKYNTDNDGNLNESEYQNFMTEWTKDHSEESPLLMQLHTKTLTDEALKLAEQCDDVDNYKGVLTEEELKKFMDLCQENKITSVFKKGVTPKGVITGSDDEEYQYNGSAYQNKDGGKAKVRWNLFKNWLKLDMLGYKGSDKFFHAVGNFESMTKGDEKIVKEVCGGQDEDKRSNMQRPENDYTEDLYANFLGREFAKLYPDANPHKLFSGLAPKGFNTDDSELSTFQLLRKRSKEKDGFIKQKTKQYFNYFTESFIVKRCFIELKETLSPKPLVAKAKSFIQEKYNNVRISLGKSILTRQLKNHGKLINITNLNQESEDLKKQTNPYKEAESYVC